MQDPKINRKHKMLQICILSIILQPLGSAAETLPKTHHYALGGKAMWTFLNAKMSGTGQPTAANRSEEELFNKSAKKNGRRLGIFGDYLYRVNQMGLGIEAFWDYGPIDRSLTSQMADFTGFDEAKYEIKQTNQSEYGLKLKAGYFMKNDLFLYGLFGIGQQKNIFEQVVTRINTGADPIPMLEERAKKRKKTNSFIIGGGVSHALLPSVMIGFEGTISYNPRRKVSFDPHAATTRGAHNYVATMPTVARINNTLYSASVKLAYTF